MIVLPRKHAELTIDTDVKQIFLQLFAGRLRDTFEIARYKRK